MLIHLLLANMHSQSDYVFRNYRLSTKITFLHTLLSVFSACRDEINKYYNYNAFSFVISSFFGRCRIRMYSNNKHYDTKTESSIFCLRKNHVSISFITNNARISLLISAWDGIIARMS